MTEKLQVNRSSWRLLICSVIIVVATSPLAADDLKVATSIKPLHSLASAVMDGVSEPTLIIPGHASPHTHTLRPSDMRIMQNSDVLFFVDETLESSIGKAAENLDDSVVVVGLMRVKGIELLKWDADYDQSSAAQGQADDDMQEKQSIDTNLYDHHIWMDPTNAIVMTNEIARVLSVHDEANAETYSKNAAAMVQSIDKLIENLNERFSSVEYPLKPFIVNHHAYQSFEHRFGLDGPNKAFMRGDFAPSARHIRELQRYVAEFDIECVFTEPQFDDDFVEVLSEVDEFKVRELDPLGASLAPGKEMYIVLIQDVGFTILDCLVAK